jgi:hypothetical protein
MNPPRLDGLRDSMASGFGLGLLLHLLGQVALGAVSVAMFPSPGVVAFFLPVLFLGWTQLLYMVPAALACQLHGHRRTATMLWIMTAVAFLATSTCAALSREDLRMLF